MASDGIDIDDLIDDLNALGTPTPAAKGNKHNSQGFASSSSSSAPGQGQGQGPSHSGSHYQHYQGSSGFHPPHNGHTSHSSSNSQNLHSNVRHHHYHQSSSSSSGNGHSHSNSDSPPGGTSYQPHPPTKKSPAQANPKNKFAVMPGDSRNSSPNSSSTSAHQNSNPFQQQGGGGAGAKGVPDSPGGDDLDSLLHMIEQTNMSPDAKQQQATVFNSPFKSNFIAQGPGGGGSAGPGPASTLTFSPELAKSSSQQFYQNFGVATTLGGGSSSASAANAGPPGAPRPKEKERERDYVDDLGDLDDDDWDRPSIGQQHRSSSSNNHQSRGGGFPSSSSGAPSSSGTTFSSLTMPQSSSSFKSSAFSNYPTTGPSGSSSGSNTSGRSSTPTMPSVNGASTSAKQSGSKSRCTRVVLAGCDAQRGLKVSAFSKVACDCLLCSQCNFKVLYFLHASWDKSVDYMFVRNNMPNVDKLKEKLLKHSVNDGVENYNNVAYCCQCQWTTVNQDRTLVPGNASDPQWICTGHS